MPDTHSYIGQRLIALRQKLRARESNPAFIENCQAIRAEIARLETATTLPADETTSPQ